MYSWKTLIFFRSKIAIYLFLGLHNGHKLHERPSILKREHQALQNMKSLYFLLYLWVIFTLLDPDPATQINTDPCGSGSTSGSSTLIKRQNLDGLWDAGELPAGLVSVLLVVIGPPVPVLGRIPRHACTIVGYSAFNQCCGSGGSICFWASWIRIRIQKYEVRIRLRLLL